eukprot:69346-Chlamydomonas_euryale.AAC.1
MVRVRGAHRPGHAQGAGWGYASTRTRMVRVGVRINPDAHRAGWGCASTRTRMVRVGGAHRPGRAWCGLGVRIDPDARITSRINKK